MKIEVVDLIVSSTVIGIGATIVMDVWVLMLQRFRGIMPLNYALVGRWLSYLTRGIFRHDNITTVKPVTAELAVGWASHYLIGIVFAGALILLAGNTWLGAPTLLPAITFGVLTVVFPFFFMQPGMGFGIAAAKAPKPNVARFRSLLTHFIFGVGLYLSATLTSLFNIL